jgi:hypothetical protein
MFERLQLFLFIYRSFIQDVLYFIQDEFTWCSTVSRKQRNGSSHSLTN